KKRVTFYIDGFNFYFCLKLTKKADSAWSNFYWIDIVKLCESFLGDGREKIYPSRVFCGLGYLL
ncbi:MAG: hypothetical protein K2M61_09615, partial [Muribaculaceae bacterium]|nr:hypothetical protein [Muribaculaceae bacterium]